MWLFLPNSFQKKTNATSKHDKEIATVRYKAILSTRGQA
jgi:phage-related protein